MPFIDDYTELRARLATRDRRDDRVPILRELHERFRERVLADYRAGNPLPGLNSPTSSDGTRPNGQ